MPKINLFFSSLFSEIKKRWNNIHLRSRRPSSRMDLSKVLFERFLRPFDNGTADIMLLDGRKKVACMRCAFCRKPCHISTHYQLGPGELYGWKCERHAHPVEYIAIPDATHYAFMFTVWLDQHEYSIEAYKLPQGEQWELREGSSLIIHFDYIPSNLTPDNIDGRLKTLILFS